MKIPGGRHRVWAAAVVLLAGAPVFSAFTAPGWELSQIAGFACVLACIVLCGCPLRPRDPAPRIMVSLSQHQLIGWIALVAAALHVGGLLLADRIVLEYLKPTAPLYQLAGSGAAVLLAVVVIGSLTGVRQRWTTQRGFRAIHVSLGCVLVALLAVHVVATDRYVGGAARRSLFVLVTAGTLAMLARVARQTATAGPAVALPRQTGFDRRPVLLVVAIAAAILGLLALLPDAAGGALRESLLAPAGTLPLDFRHDKHSEVNCLACHHNYVKRQGSENCIPCHRSPRTDLKTGAESRFHGFCFDCHRRPDPKFKHHGPVSGCVVCHREAGGTSSRSAARPS